MLAELTTVEQEAVVFAPECLRHGRPQLHAIKLTSDSLTAIPAGIARETRQRGKMGNRLKISDILNPNLSRRGSGEKRQTPIRDRFRGSCHLWMAPVLQEGFWLDDLI